MGDTNIWLWLGGQLIASAAIWGAIRADIRAMHTRIEDAKKTASGAHERIDRILERGH